MLGSQGMKMPPLSCRLLRTENTVCTPVLWERFWVSTSLCMPVPSNIYVFILRQACMSVYYYDIGELYVWLPRYELKKFSRRSSCTEIRGPYAWFMREILGYYVLVYACTVQYLGIYSPPGMYECILLWYRWIVCMVVEIWGYNICPVDRRASKLWARPPGFWESFWISWA